MIKMEISDERRFFALLLLSLGCFAGVVLMQNTMLCLGFFIAEMICFAGIFTISERLFNDG